MLGTRILVASSALRLAGARSVARSDWLRGLHASRPALQLVTEKLPSLGDSITEGTLNSWTKKVGEKVAVDDVIAVIETDKVSVDLRVPVAGVLSKQMAAEGDTVLVGTDLYVIDTEGKATASSSSPAQSATSAGSSAPATQPQATAAAPQPASGAQRRRQPLIKFLGKRSLLKQQQQQQQQTTGQRTQTYQAPKVVKHSPNAIDFTELPGRAMHGRPPLTQKEIDYIESGGASMW